MHASIADILTMSFVCCSVAVMKVFHSPVDIKPILYMNEIKKRERKRNRERERERERETEREKERERVYICVYYMFVCFICYTLY